MESKTNKQPKPNSLIQRVRQGMGEMHEGGQKVQTSSYKINKLWGCNV